jgi:hypothetical protein
MYLSTSLEHSYIFWNSVFCTGEEMHQINTRNNDSYLLFYTGPDVSDKTHRGNGTTSGFKQIRRANRNYRCVDH